MKATSITWRRTFPDSKPGTDGVAMFEGRVIGRVRYITTAPRDPKPWSWSITDPELAGRPGWGRQGEGGFGIPGKSGRCPSVPVMRPSQLAQDARFSSGRSVEALGRG